MDCTDFRRHHLAYLDDTLPGDLVVPAERHVRECAACAAHDTAVRRALLLARNVPTISCSPDFHARLAARLREVDAGEVDVPMDWTPTWQELARERLRDVREGRFATPFDTRSVAPRPLASRRTVAVAATLVAMASVGAVTLRDDDRSTSLPTVATQAALTGGTPAAPLAPPPVGEPRFERLPAAELVGPVTAGVPVFPAALLAGETPVELMGLQGAAGFELVSFGQ